jgi:hypothetical protein
MDNIVIVEGADLDDLLPYLAKVAGAHADGQVFHVRFCVDSGGLKVKINERVWSAPMGRMERTEVQNDGGAYAWPDPGFS